MEKTLWVNDSQRRYFLIPVEQDLPVGPMVLRSLTGQEQFVESAAVAQYQISEAEAEGHLESQIDQAMEKARSALGQAWVADPVALSFDENSEALGLLSSLVGTSPETLRQDPQQVKQYLNSFLSELRSGMEAGLEDPDALIPIQRRLDQVQAQLRQQGIPLDLNLTQSIYQMQQQGGSVEEMEQLLESLQPLILLLRQSIQASPELQAALIDLVPTSTVPPADPQVQEDYRQSARQAVSEVMKNVKVPTFKFEDLAQPPSDPTDLSN